MSDPTLDHSSSNSRIPIPNATATLVLGIISIISCFCYGIPGIICGIIALVIGSKALKEYNMNPEGYDASGLGSLKAGRVCAIIGLVLSVLTLVYMIVLFATIGTGSLDIMEQLKQIEEENNASYDWEETIDDDNYHYEESPEVIEEEVIEELEPEN